MDGTENLAANLGLGTNNRFVNTMPFTKAANTELSMAIQEKKAEEQRLNAEKKLQEQIKARVKSDPKGLDKIGSEIYKESFARTVASGADPESVYNHNNTFNEQLAESKALETISNTAEKMLLPQDIKDAYRKRDYDYIKAKAQENPNLGITISNSGRPLINPNKIVADVSIDDYFGNLTKNYSKNEGDWLPIKGGVEKKFDKVFQKAVLKPELLQREVESIFSADPRQSEEDRQLEQNYLVKREKEISQEMAKPIYAQFRTDEEKLIAAAKNVFMNEAKSKVINEIDATPRRTSGSGGSGLSKDKVFVEQKTDNPNALTVKASTSNDLVARRFMAKIKDDSGVVQTVEKMGVPYEFEPQKDGSVKVSYTFKGEDGDEFTTATLSKGDVLDMLPEGQSPTSRRKFLEVYDKVVKPKAEKSKKKIAKISDIKSKVGKKGFEGYTEKELVDYYKSQGYTIE